MIRIEGRSGKLSAAVGGVICLLPLAATPAGAAPPGADYRLVWGDEFNGNFLDVSKWNVNYPWGTTHNHNATMSAGQIALGDGTMTITATRTGSGSNDFVSGAINTGYTKKTFNGGYLEASIKLPSTVGSWPAFWGLYDGWPPEVDIMEFPLGDYDSGDYHTAFHYRNSSGGNSAGAGKINDALGGAPLYNDYHTFGMEWIEDDWVGFYFNGQLVSQFGDDSAVAQMQRMYLILNYAVGGWPGTPSTSQWAVGHSDQMKVDWVRVWDITASLDRTSQWIGGSGGFDNTANWSNGTPSQGNQHMVFSAEDGVSRTIDWIGERRTGNLELGGNAPFILGNGQASVTMSDVDGTPNIMALPGTTVAHEIRAVIDPVGDLAITNDGGAGLRLSGIIRGSENILVDGAAPVVFSGNNRYSGDTIIDSGSQGSAIVRVEHSNALGTGTIIFNPQGNNTAGQLQLANGITLQNNVSLTGRHNTTPAILNLSGNNTLSGNIDLQVGGGNYRIASEGGVLTLAGTLRASASGTRTFTFDGSANGRVTGNIVNENAVINVTKTGASTWTLEGTNTYTGATTVESGTLSVNGSHIGGAGYNVGPDSTLAGTGIIDLQSGTTVMVAGVLSPGNNVGTLRVGAAGSPNDVIFEGGTLLIEIGDEEADLLDISGGLDLTSDSDVLSLVPLDGTFNGSTYTIASFTPGTLSGVFDTVLIGGASLENGYGVIYDNAAGKIRLTPIPEPGSLALLGTAGLLLARRRRYGRTARGLPASPSGH